MRGYVLVVLALVALAFELQLVEAQVGLEGISGLKKVLDEVQGVEEKPCDRALARQGREIIQREVFDYVKKHTPKKYEIFSLCPLQPIFDLYAEELKHTKRVGPDNWKCLYCHKSKFRTLEALDLHMEHRHSDKLDGGVCLAEHLDYLTGKVGMQDGKCNKEILADRKYYCEYMMMRCFPPAAHELNEALLKHFKGKFCNRMRCGDAFGPRELLAMLDETRRDPWSHLRLTFVIFSLVLIVIFYCGAIVYYREGRAAPDLPARKRGMLAWLTSPFHRRPAKIKKQ